MKRLVYICLIPLLSFSESVYDYYTVYHVEYIDGITAAAAYGITIYTWYEWYEYGEYQRIIEYGPNGVHLSVNTAGNVIFSFYKGSSTTKDTFRLLGFIVYDHEVPVTFGVVPSAAFPDPSDPDPEKANTEEPINFISGNSHFSAGDLHIPTPGIPLDFARTYNSTDTNATVLGKGWRHTYDWALNIQTDQVSVTCGNARTYTFAGDTNEGYSASFDNNWQLTGLSDGEYTLLLPESTTYRFNTIGVLQQIEDGWSNSISLIYSNGLLTAAEHSSGQALTFSYSNDLLQTVTAATNLAVLFSYESGGTLTGVVRQAGADLFQESFCYDSSSLLTQRVDSVGNEYHYTYSDGKATGMNLGTNQWYHHTVEYSNELSRVTYMRNNEEIIHEYTYSNEIKRVLGERLNNTEKTVTYAYDDFGNTTEKIMYAADTNHWLQISRLYDDWHNITNEAFGLCATPTNITQTTWNTNWHVVASITDPEGFKTEFEYTNGVIALNRIYLSSNETVETAYSYTTNGLLESITNANGHSIAFTYDSLGYPASVVPLAGPTVTLGYDTLGHLTNSALPGGRTTDYTVTPLGWVERIETADDLCETFQYDGLGNVTNYVDRAGRNTDYEYYPGGKLKSVRRQFGTTNTVVSYAYDQQFNSLSITDELNRPVESYLLDALDRPTTVTNVEGQTMTINWLVEDFVNSITRFDNTVVSNQYTGDGWIKAVHYPDETNSYTYLRNGLLQTAGDSGSWISNGWNSASWLTQTVFSASSVTSVVDYAYDPVGNVTNAVVSMNNPAMDGLTMAYYYDEAERLSSLSAGYSTSNPQTFDYSYNTDNGLVASVSNVHLRAEYDYDIMDRVKTISWKDSWGATLLSFDYRYNAVGMITNIVRSNGSETFYRYDDLDRLTREDSGDSWAEYSYDLAGNRQAKTASDYSVAYTPGSGNRLTAWNASSSNGFERFRTLEVHGSASEPIGTDNRWGQLWVSNSVAVTPEVSGTNFWIDAFTVGMGTQQVVAAIRDEAGNMGYATNEFFLTVVTNAAYGYNAAGCATNIAYTGTEYGKSISLNWNHQYQLTSVSSATSAVEYSYDVLGRRVLRVGNGVTNLFVYDGNQVVADLEGNGNLLRTYVWGPGIDNLLALTTYGEQTNTYYALKDHLNSVHALVDEAGTIVESYSYDVWGHTTVYDAAGNELSESVIGNRYLWQGREYDAASGLYYFRARWYSPILGRFISKDLIGISGGLNQYVFCGNNPCNFVDPMGLWQATIGAAYGYGGRISFGKNNGRWNIDFGLGYGLGAMASFSKEDTGRGYASHGRSANIGLEVSGSAKIIGLDVGGGLRVGAETDSCNNAEARGGLFGDLRIPGTLLNAGGALEGVFRSDLSGGIEVSRSPVELGLGGMVFGGITGGWTWYAK